MAALAGDQAGPAQRDQGPPAATMCATNRDLLTIASRRQLTGPSPSAHRHGGGWQRGELEPHRAMPGIDQAASLCPIAVLPTAAKM